MLASSYSLSVIAQTSPGGLTSILQGASINDSGHVAFVASDSGGQGIYHYNGAGLVEVATDATFTYGRELQLNNSDQIAAVRIRGATRSVRIWNPDSPDSTIEVAQASTTFPRSPELFAGLGDYASIANSGEVAFAALDDPPVGDDVWEVHLSDSTVAPADDSNRIASFATNVVFRPFTADNGRTVLGTRQGATRRITVYDSTPIGGSDHFLASTVTGPWADLGLRPGISDDGTVVVFAGTHTSYGFGIFASKQTPTGYSEPVKIAGISGDGILDPGESWDDVNGNSLVDIGEDHGVFNSFSQDVRIAANRNGDSSTVVFVATGTDGQMGVFTLKLDVSALPSANAVTDIQVVVRAGDNIVSLSGTVQAVGIHDAINRGGQLAFHVQMSSGATAIIKASLPSKAVVVLTHGFGNTWNAPVIGPTTLPGFSTFLDNWNALAEKFERMPALGSPLYESVSAYKANWNSSDGWVDAAISLLSSALLLSQGRVFHSGVAAANVLNHMQKAGLNAEQAALEIVADLISSGLLTSPEATLDGRQAIQLVGHSRGAAVNARVAELLSQKGYRVQEYIALDGYSTDWPNLGGLLGDIEIVATIGRASPNIVRAVNYRVEVGLAELGFNFLEPILDVVGDALPIPLGGPILTSVTTEILRLALPDWRAPERVNFDSNEVIRGENVESTHLNVTPLYLGTDLLGIKPYIDDSYVGRNSAPGGAASNQLLVSSARFKNVETNAALAAFHAPFGFADRDFESTANIVQATQVTEVLSNEELLVRLWGTVVGDPQYALSTFWETSGETKLVVEAGSARAELREGVDTSLGQLIYFAPGDKRLEFDLTVISPGGGDELTITLGNHVLSSIPLAGATRRQVIALPLALPEVDEIKFSLSANGGATAIVQLDNIALMGDPGDFDRNGAVDGNDFLIWQRQLGTTGDSEADGDLSGLVDGEDLAIWKGTFGAVMSQIAAAPLAVSETASASTSEQGAVVRTATFGARPANLDLRGLWVDAIFPRSSGVSAKTRGIARDVEFEDSAKQVINSLPSSCSASGDEANEGFQSRHRRRALELEKSPNDTAFDAAFEVLGIDLLL